jgi:hypothetical protein
VALPPALVLTMPDDNPKKFAVDLMVEVAKQLITLASGALVLSISFMDFIGGDAPSALHGFWLVIASWIMFLASILTGLLALGALAAVAHLHGQFDVDTPMARLLLALQQLLFIVAFAAFVWFAIENYGV